MASRHRLLNTGIETKLGQWPHHVLIFRLFDRWRLLYRAFCAGSIIGEMRVLTSSHCFLTNKKHLRYELRYIRVVGGILHTMAKQPFVDEIQQWRSIDQLYSQRFYRFPAYNLAVVIINKPWNFNRYINKIPFSSTFGDYDGVCTATAVKATKSWSKVRYLHTEEVEMINREACERILCRSCRLFMCTVADLHSDHAFSETEGGGLVCYDTGDPNELDEEQGVLVAVTSIINIGLPSLHMRVGLFHQWVEDLASRAYINKFIILICVTICLIKIFLM
ncbi:unnamed protein product [Chrysodeixis includens]|uniref:Peptidase S1 domain-containing protein n=1 Tax=Chrysodeixis includens TaxID=689277 RepID=A0A9P0BJB5_CHRIL|nr:unnamed protein product [Chrysodeixis includens]